MDAEVLRTHAGGKKLRAPPLKKEDITVLEAGIWIHKCQNIKSTFFPGRKGCFFCVLFGPCRPCGHLPQRRASCRPFSAG